MKKRDLERERARELLRRLGRRWDEIDVGVVVRAFRAEHAETWDEAAKYVERVPFPRSDVFRRRAKRLRGSR